MDRIGRYEIRSELGRGGFGIVYRAHDPVMQREVAIKVLTALDDPSLLDRFRREAGTTGKLQHKNIVTVYDYGEHEGQPFFVMELLEGSTLKDVIDRKVPLSLYRRVYIMTQIAEGLQYAHQKQVIHRDIKPANIVLLADGTVKIVDFGIARIVDATRTRATVPGLLMGTVEYMAPEQLHGKDADKTAEVFSYGVVFYETLSGVNPFRAAHFTEVMQLLATADPQPLRKASADCPEAAEALARKCLAKNPDNRVQSMEEVLNELLPLYIGLRRERANGMAEEVRKLIGDGQLPEAESALQRLLEFDRENHEGHDLRRRLEREKRDAAARERGAKVERAVRETLAAGKIREAVPLATELAGLLPDNPVFGELFRQTMDLDEIQTRVRALRDRTSDQAAARELDAACTTAAGAVANEKMAESVPQLIKALRRRLEVREREAAEVSDKQKAEADLAEATTLFQSAKYSESRQIVERLLAGQPDHAGARRLLDQITIAEAAVRRERSIVGKLAGADQMLHRRRYDEAVDSLKAALAEFGEEVRLRNALESAIAAQKRDQAISRAAVIGGEETIDLDPKKPATVSDVKPAAAPEPKPAPVTAPAPPVTPAPAPASLAAAPPPARRSPGVLRAILALVLLAAGIAAGYQLWLRGRTTEAPAPVAAAPRVLLEAPSTTTPEQAAVVATIDHFLHAVSAGDGDAVKAVWPTAPPGTLQAWSSNLVTSAASGPHLLMQGPPEVTGRSARVVTEIHAATTDGPAKDRKYTFTLKKRGEDWLISAVR